MMDVRIVALLTAFLLCSASIAFWLTTVIERYYVPASGRFPQNLTSCPYVMPLTGARQTPGGCSKFGSSTGDSRQDAGAGVSPYSECSADCDQHRHDTSQVMSNPLLSNTCTVDVENLFQTMTSLELALIRVYVVMEIDDVLGTWRLAPGQCPNSSELMRSLYGEDLYSGVSNAVPQDLHTNLTFLFERQALRGSGRAFARAFVTLSPFFELVLPSAFSPLVGWSSRTNTVKIKLTRPATIRRWRSTRAHTKTDFIKEALQRALQRKLKSSLASARHLSEPPYDGTMLHGHWHTRFLPRDNVITNLGFELASVVYHTDCARHGNALHNGTRIYEVVTRFHHWPLIGAVISASVQCVFGLVSLHLLIWSVSRATAQWEKFHRRQAAYGTMAADLERGVFPRQLMLVNSSRTLRAFKLFVAFLPCILLPGNVPFVSFLTSNTQQVFDMHYSACGVPVLWSLVFVSMTLVAPFTLFLLVLQISRGSVLDPMERLGHMCQGVAEVMLVLTAVVSFLLAYLFSTSELKVIATVMQAYVKRALLPILPDAWLVGWNPVILLGVVVVMAVFVSTLVLTRDTISAQFGQNFAKLSWYRQYESICRTCWRMVDSPHSTLFGPVSVIVAIEYGRYYLSGVPDICPSATQNYLMATDLPFWLHPHTAAFLQRLKWPLLVFMLLLVCDRILFVLCHTLRSSCRGYTCFLVACCLFYVMDLQRHWLVKMSLQRLENHVYRLSTIVVYFIFYSLVAQPWNYSNRVFYPIGQSCLAGLLFVAFQIIQMNFEFILRRTVLVVLAVILHIPMILFILFIGALCVSKLCTDRFLPTGNMSRFSAPIVRECAALVNVAAHRLTMQQQQQVDAVDDQPALYPCMAEDGHDGADEDDDNDDNDNNGGDAMCTCTPLQRYRACLGLAQCRVFLVLVNERRQLEHQALPPHNGNPGNVDETCDDVEEGNADARDLIDDETYQAMMTSAQQHVGEKTVWTVFTLISFPLPVVSILFLNWSNFVFFAQLAPDNYGRAVLQALTILLLIWKFQSGVPRTETVAESLNVRRVELRLLEELIRIRQGQASTAP